MLVAGERVAHGKRKSENKRLAVGVEYGASGVAGLVCRGQLLIAHLLQLGASCQVMAQLLVATSGWLRE